MIYHSFPALSRYCPSNYGPCGNHMTLYINLKQQEDKGVIYTRGRDGEHRHNEDAPKQDTGTLSPARLTLTKPTALWDIWARQCKKSQSVFFFFFFLSNHLLLSQGERGAGFYPRVMNDHRSQFLPAHLTSQSLGVRPSQGWQQRHLGQR